MSKVECKEIVCHIVEKITSGKKAIPNVEGGLKFFGSIFHLFCRRFFPTVRNDKNSARSSCTHCCFVEYMSHLICPLI